MTRSKSMMERITTHAKRPIAITCALALAVSIGSCGLLTGCSSDSGTDAKTSEDSSDEVINIESRGFNTLTEGEVQYAFSVINKKSGQLASNTLFAVQAYNINNEAIAGTSVTIPTLYPGVETYCAGIMTYYNQSATADGAAADATPATDAVQASATPADGARDVADDADAPEGEPVVISDESSEPIEETAESLAISDAVSDPNAVMYIAVTPMPDTIEWSDTDVKPDQVEGVVKIGEAEAFTVSNDMVFEASYSVPPNSVYEGKDLRFLAVVYDYNGNLIGGTDPTYYPSEDGEFSLWLHDMPPFDDYKIVCTPAELIDATAAANTPGDSTTEADNS